MNKKSKAKYVVQCDNHPVHQTTNLCIFMENEELVDLTVICDTFSVRVHKCILGANSAYFLDHLQRDVNIDRVVIQGIKQNVVKALIEFMYCGETSVPDEDMDELVAAANFFGIRAISALAPDSLGGHSKSRKGSKNKLESTPPQFLKKNQNHNRRRSNSSRNPTTMYHELISHTAADDDETKQYITIKNQLLINDTFSQPPRETYEQNIYDTPESIDLKFESLELVEINTSIKNELNEFLNIANEEEANYQEVTNASGFEPIFYTDKEQEYMAVDFEDKEHVCLLEAAKTLTATSVTYTELELASVTGSEYNLESAEGEQNVQVEHEAGQDTIAEPSTQPEPDTVAEPSIEQDTVASLSIEQDAVAAPSIEQDIIVKPSTQLKHETVAEPVIEQDTVAGPPTQLEQDYQLKHETVADYEENSTADDKQNIQVQSYSESLNLVVKKKSKHTKKLKNK